MIYLFPSSHIPLQPTSITPVDLYPHRQTLMTLFQISCIHRFFWQNGSSMKMSAKTRGGGRRLCDARTPVHRWLVGVETRSQAHNSQCCARPVIFAGFFAASVYAIIYSYWKWNFLMVGRSVGRSVCHNCTSYASIGLVSRRGTYIVFRYRESILSILHRSL